MIKHVVLKKDAYPTPKTDAAMEACGKLPDIAMMYGYMAEHAKELERELAVVVARAKVECENWMCSERMDFKGEWCPNCPYELVIRAHMVRIAKEAGVKVFEVSAASTTANKP